MSTTKTQPDLKESQHMTGLTNYAGRADIDTAMIEELELAGIEHQKLPECCRASRGEVQTIVIGILHGWSFTRAWRYWVCDGPGIPVEAAMLLHATFGQQVRVDGHCGCPSPLEWFHGLGTGSYHVDTLRGLKALADTIKAVVEKAKQPTTQQAVEKATT